MVKYVCNDFMIADTCVVKLDGYFGNKLTYLLQEMEGELMLDIIIYSMILTH